MIRKTNRSLRRHRTTSMATANAAKKKAVEEIIDGISDLTPQTAYAPSTLSTNTSISSTTLSFNTSIIEEVVIRSVDRLWKSSWKKT